MPRRLYGLLALGLALLLPGRSGGAGAAGADGAGDLTRHALSELEVLVQHLLLREESVPSVSAALVRYDEPVVTADFAPPWLLPEESCAPGAVYGTGSIAKVMVATALLQGLALHLYGPPVTAAKVDAVLRQRLDEGGCKELLGRLGVSSLEGGATVGGLLSHRGQAEFDPQRMAPEDLAVDTPHPWDEPGSYTLLAQTRHLVRMREPIPGSLSGAPHYSNDAYLLAGALLAALDPDAHDPGTEPALEAELRRQLWDPLGMSSTGVFGPPPDDPRRALPMTWMGASYQAGSFPRFRNLPGLGLSSTAGDLGRFLRAHLRAARGLTLAPGLRPAAFRATQRPPPHFSNPDKWPLRTGTGWLLPSEAGTDHLVRHAGRVLGYTGQVSADLQAGVGVCLLCNANLAVEDPRWKAVPGPDEGAQALSVPENLPSTLALVAELVRHAAATGEDVTPTLPPAESTALVGEYSVPATYGMLGGPLQIVNHGPLTVMRTPSHLWLLRPDPRCCPGTAVAWRGPGHPTLRLSFWPRSGPVERLRLNEGSWIARDPRLWKDGSVSGLAGWWSGALPVRPEASHAELGAGVPLRLVLEDGEEGPRVLVALPGQWLAAEAVPYALPEGRLRIVVAPCDILPRTELELGLLDGRLVGTWRQPGFTRPLDLRRTGEAADPGVGVRRLKGWVSLSGRRVQAALDLRAGGEGDLTLEGLRLPLKAVRWRFGIGTFRVDHPQHGRLSVQVVARTSSPALEVASQLELRGLLCAAGAAGGRLLLTGPDAPP